MNSTPQPTYDELIKQAECHLNAYEHDKVIECATQAIELDNTRPDAYYWRGRVYWRIHNKEDTQKDADMLLACTPVTPRHFAYRGRAYCVKEEYQQAVTECREALRQEPLLKEAYFFRGWAYNGLKEFDLAILDFNQAIILDPKDAITYINRGIAYDNKTRYDLAIADYDKAIELDPKCAAAYNNRGIAYTKSGNNDCAIKDYTATINLDSKYSKAYYNRGNVYYYKLKNYKLAITDYNKAIELAPKNATAYYHRGNAYYRKGSYCHAIKDWGKAIENKHRSRRVFENLFFNTIINKRKEWLASPVEDISFMKDTLRKSSHYWVSLIGDILFDIENTGDAMKYIKLIEAVYKLPIQIEEDAKKKLTGEGCYFYQYAERAIVDEIRKNKTLWLTPACYQNDPDEGKYIFDYLASHDKINKALKELIGELRADDSFDKRAIAFIRSFSECKDDLLMWNSSYAKNGTGVALGIHSSKLNQAKDSSATTLRILVQREELPGENKAHPATDSEDNVSMEKIYFARVRYLTEDKDKEKECKKDTDAFEDVITALKEFSEEFLASAENKNSVKDFFRQIFMPISHLVKNANYIHEKEWRLLYLTPIRDGNKSQKIKLDPLRVESEKFLFQKGKTPEELWLGPKFDTYPELERLKIGHLFEYHGLGDTVSIHTSKVHFR